MEMRKLLEAMNKFASAPVNEGKVKEVSMDLKDLTDAEFKQKYNKTKEEMRASLGESYNMLGELSQLSQDMSVENKLKEMWAKFNEDDIGVAPNRPHRKGTRADKLGRRGHKEQPRYITVKEVETIAPIKPIKPGNAPANPAADPNAIKQAIAATAAMKAATGSSAPAPNLAKALDAASQGKPISSTDAKVMEPIMDIVSKAAQDPKLANQFKTLAQQAKNTL